MINVERSCYTLSDGKGNNSNILSESVLSRISRFCDGFLAHVFFFLVILQIFLFGLFVCFVSPLPIRWKFTFLIHFFLPFVNFHKL